ncbi:MAG: ExsB family transcriptional regulator [Candidatus Hydrogenedentes bacterium]|nr:ExsB family transcriptional regulator [Candidatus Hydrogenedentota bacterium]
MIQEITVKDLDTTRFIEDKVNEIREAVGADTCINTLSGGVDSATVTMLGHAALGSQLRTVIIDNGIMREGEPERVTEIFQGLGVKVDIIQAQQIFHDALKGVTDPEEKREVIRQCFYKDVFAKVVKESGAKVLLQGTILTDVDETVAGVKRQHNVFAQLGIDPEQAFGYKILEPLIQLRKDGVRELGKTLGLPPEIYGRIPFPGPGLAARIIGEVTPERLVTVRKATAIMERYLKDSGAFQYMAILHEDRVTGTRGGKRDFGLQIEVRCWESVDARTAVPTPLSFDLLTTMANEITEKVPGVVSVTYNIASKPPSTLEVI